MMPAAIICMLALMLVLPLVTEYFEYSEPIDHIMLPQSSTKKLIICDLFPSRFMEPLFAESITMPPRPTISPMMINLSEKFAFRCFLSSITNQNGVVAIIIEQRPAGRYCSAQMSDVVPKNNISMPAKAFFETEIRSGFFSPFTMHHTYNMMPAAKKRIAAIRKGGTLFIASAMPM